MKHTHSLSFLCMTTFITNAGFVHAQSYHRDMQVRQRPVASVPKIPNAPQNYGYQGYRQSYQAPNPTVAPVRPVPQAISQPVMQQRAISQPVQVNPMKFSPQSQPAQPVLAQPAQPVPVQDDLSQKAIEQQRNWQQFVPAHVRDAYKPKAFNATVYTGYRVDNLKWDVAGSNISKLSELTYEDIGSAEIGIQADYTVQEGLLAGLYAEGRASYAKTFLGSHEDSDFLSELDTLDEDGNPTGETASGIFEFSRTTGDSDDGDAHNFRAALGYEVWRYINRKTSMWLTPIAGYSYNQLDITMTNGEIRDPRGGISTEGENLDVITDPPIIDGTPFQGLNSSYNTKWQGAFLGAIAGYHFENHMLLLRGEVHKVDYEAEAQWNLRDDFAQPLSFAHEGDGYGYEIGLDYSYYFTDAFAVMAGLSYRDFSIEDGTDTIYLSDGNVISTDRLNNVAWSTQLYRVGGKYSF